MSELTELRLVGRSPVRQQRTSAAQPVRRDPANPTLLDQFVHHSCESFGREPSAPRSAEHEIVVSPRCVAGEFGVSALAVLDKHPQHRRRKGHRTTVAVRHRLQPGPAALDHQLLSDPQATGIEVEVRPPQTKQLTSPQAGDNRQVERRPQPMASGRRQEPLRLVRRPTDRPGRRRHWCLGALHRVVGQEAPIDGVGAGHREHLADQPHRGRRQRPSAVLSPGAAEAAQPAVEDLRLEFGKLGLTQDRHDVPADRPRVHRGSPSLGRGRPGAAQRRHAS